MYIIFPTSIQLIGNLILIGNRIIYNTDSLSLFLRVRMKSRFYSSKHRGATLLHPIDRTERGFYTTPHRTW